MALAAQAPKVEDGRLHGGGWFNYLRASAYHGCEVSCQGVPDRIVGGVG